MALGSTQPLTEMSTRCISWGKGGRCVGLTTLPPSCAVVMKSGNLNFLEPSGPLQACNGTALPFTLYEPDISLLIFQVPSFYQVIRPKLCMRFSGHIYSMWPTDLNLLDPKLWCPNTIPRAVIPYRLFPFSAPLIWRLFDILQSFVQHCKVHTQ